jgi:hypothetical protein
MTDKVKINGKSFNIVQDGWGTLMAYSVVDDGAIFVGQLFFDNSFSCEIQYYDWSGVKLQSSKDDVYEYFNDDNLSDIKHELIKVSLSSHKIKKQ